MPAIQLERLQVQVTQIGDLFLQPAKLVSQLQDLFDFYADRTRRPGQVGTRVPLLPHQNIPTPVMRELSLELQRRARSSATTDIFYVADTLWAAERYETRLLAAGLLGAMEAGPEEISARLSRWSTQTSDQAILTTLLQNGHNALERVSPGAWLELTRLWLEDERPAVQAAGLGAAGLVIQAAGYENYPQIFNMLSAIIQSPPATLQLSISSLIRILAERSPTETMIFLRHALTTSPEHSITRLVRRCLPFFSPENQQILRQALAARLSVG